MIRILGVDPGLVHTGTVLLEVEEAGRRLHVSSHVIEGDDSHAEQLAAHLRDLPPLDHIFVEAYRERGNSYGTDSPMRELLFQITAVVPRARLLDNTGVRKVVRPALLKKLGLDSFPTTHHQDLQAAARILVYGMLKKNDLNTILARLLAEDLDGDPWQVYRVQVPHVQGEGE